MPRRKKSHGTGVPLEQLRLNLCFRADDPTEKMAYDMLQSPSAKKCRSHLVAQAIIGMLYLGVNGDLTAHTVDDIVEKTVQRCVANAGPIFVHDTVPDKSMGENPKPEENALSQAQMAALDDIIGNFSL